MTPEAIREAAKELANAKKEQWRINLSGDAEPKTEEDAIAISEALWEIEGGETAGWKIGAGDPAARAKQGLKNPFVGRIPKADVTNSPAVFHFPETRRPAVEAEYAFFLANDLPARGEEYSRAEVEAAVQAMHIAIEIPESRLIEDHGLGALGVVCDHGGVGRYVLGPGVADWKEHDFLGQEVVMTIDGEEKGRGTGASVMGHPLDALTWIANHLSRKGIGLEAGQFVSTGSCTGIALVQPDAQVVADFGPLGEVRVEFPN